MQDELAYENTELGKLYEEYLDKWFEENKVKEGSPMPMCYTRWCKVNNFDK